MSEGISIRSMTTADLVVFRSIRLEALRESPLAFASTFLEESALSDEQWLERLRRMEAGETCGFLALSDDTPCGLVGGVVEGEDVLLVSMWVAPAARGKRVGRALIHAVEGWTIRKNRSRIHLHVTDGNDAALRLYTRCGFIDSGLRLPYPNDPSIEEIEMVKELDDGESCA